MFSGCWWPACCASWLRVWLPCTSTARSAAISTRRCSATGSETALFLGNFGVLGLLGLTGSDLSGKPFDNRRRHHRRPGELAHGGLEAAGETPRGLRAVDRLSATFYFFEQRSGSEDGPGRGGDEPLADDPDRSGAELADDLRGETARVGAELGLDLADLAQEQGEGR